MEVKKTQTKTLKMMDIGALVPVEVNHVSKTTTQIL
jgi:hypothetical protein